MHWYKKLGPGLLYAGAAIGVSHLVQSTRAGALYGFDLVLVVLLINLIKYPFFEASGRFVAAEKENLLEGYSKIHPTFLFIFLLQTFMSPCLSFKQLSQSLQLGSSFTHSEFSLVLNSSVFFFLFFFPLFFLEKN